MVLKEKFPGWRILNKEGITVAFKDLQCIEGFKVAVRVGLDGVLVFGKNNLTPSLGCMNPFDFASLADFKGKSGEGIRPFEVGCVRLDGSIWFSDCIYEPGLIEEDYNELKSILLAIHNLQSKPTKKQLARIKRMKELRGEQFIKDYFFSKFPTGDYENLTRENAQKIITGLQWIEPKAPLKNVVCKREYIS
ncbi:hypothetical protein D1B31_18330 [Neobacillus notoginsengisoli]|uniref:Uncharacterized protein n=1 Tax=Neobacillus notoginsengisoli TaxID=1578198 RepID=A0A417YQM1_9BACI|nr:hypothetical protein [Neobacillus notoginsengisoli]RHW36041.1 hypothetical protein D1B31_18330 [Neobacillus notoginsengisoli]